MAILESTANSYGAVFNPQAPADFLFDRLLPMIVAGKAGFRTVRTNASSLSVPTITGDPTSGVVAEGSTIPLSDPSGSAVVATPRKFAVATQVSREAMTDLSPAGDLADIIGNQMMRSLAYAVDNALFQGNPSATPPQPRGLVNVAGIQAVTGTAPDASLDPYVNAIGQLMAADSNAQPAILMAPATWTALTLLKRSATGLADANAYLLQPNVATAADRQLFGVPVYLSPNCVGASAAKQSYVVDTQNVVLVWRNDATVDVSNDAAFLQDSVVLRATCRLDIVVPQAQAVVRIAAA